MAEAIETQPALAWARYKPSPRRPWNLARAAHLWRRAGFGATWDELQQSLKAGPQRTIDRLLRPEGDVAGFNETHDGYEKASAAAGSAGALRAWWLRRMIQTPHPLGEKMTLFWHDFFAAAGDRVGSARLIRRHVSDLRAGAMGDFRKLLSGALRDPAVLLALGAGANRKARPDDKLARQLLHRYTVGPADCTERDVRETARAMTGWFVLRMRLRHIDREHDGGAKTVLGKTGKFNDRTVAQVAASHPATARNVVRRLYRWFISETDSPDDKLLAPLAESFAKDFDVAGLVETILRSNLFFFGAVFRRKVKRPVEFAVGIIRGLEAMVPTTRLASDLAAVGENLYNPPTRNGWAGGRCWLNSATLIGRSNLAAALLAPSGAYGGKLDPAAVSRRHGHADAKSAGKFLASLFLQPDQGIREHDGIGGRDTGFRMAAGRSRPVSRAPIPSPPIPTDLRRLTHTIVTQPEFQLA